MLSVPDRDVAGLVLYEKAEKGLESVLAGSFPRAVAGGLEQVAERWWCLHQVSSSFGHHPANVKGNQIVELAERRIRGRDCAVPRTHQILFIVLARSRGVTPAMPAAALAVNNCRRYMLCIPPRRIERLLTPLVDRFRQIASDRGRSGSAQFQSPEITQSNCWAVTPVWLRSH